MEKVDQMEKMDQMEKVNQMGNVKQIKILSRSNRKIPSVYLHYRCFRNYRPRSRNRIYECVLTHEKPLYCHRLGYPSINKFGLYAKYTRCTYNSNCLCEACHPEDEFNRLKLVSRKFYWETAGLELRYNDIVFKKAGQYVNLRASAAVPFLLFFDFTISVSWQARLHKVYIRHDRDVKRIVYKYRTNATICLDINSWRRNQLLPLCAQNPNLTIMYEIHGFGVYLGPDFVNLGLLIHQAAREYIPRGIFNPFPVCQGPVWAENVAKIRSVLSGGQKLPKNLKFLPHTLWDKEAWLAGMKRLRKRLRFTRWEELNERYDAKNGLETWLKEAERWYQEGNLSPKDNVHVALNW